MKKIITISREYGAGGHSIGVRVAKELGIPFYDRDIILETAKASGFDMDLIENEVRKALGMPLTEIKQTQCDGHWCEMIVHANIEKEGLLEEIVIDPVIMEKHVKVVDFAVKKGDLVKPFTGANMSLGDIFLRFDSRAELDDVMKRSNDWLKVILQ